MSELAKESIDAAMQIASAAGQTASEILEAFAKILEDNYEKDHVDELLKAIKTGKGIKPIACAEGWVMDFTKNLSQRNIPFVVTRDSETGISAVMIPTDAEAESIIAMEEVKQKKCHMSETTLPVLAQDRRSNIYAIKNISETEYRMIAENAYKSKLKFAKEINEDNTYNIYCKKDMSRLLANEYNIAKATLSGRSGQCIREEYEKSNKVTQDILSKFVSPEYKNGFFVISGTNPNNVIEVTQNGIDHKLLKPDGGVFYYSQEEGDKRDLLPDCIKTLNTIPKPVFVTTKDYQSMEGDKNKLQKYAFDKMPKIQYQSQDDKQQVIEEKTIKFFLNSIARKNPESINMLSDLLKTKPEMPDNQKLENIMEHYQLNDIGLNRQMGKVQSIIPDYACNCKYISQYCDAYISNEKPRIVSLTRDQREPSIDEKIQQIAENRRKSKEKFEEMVQNQEKNDIYRDEDPE